MLSYKGLSKTQRFLLCALIGTLAIGAAGYAAVAPGDIAIIGYQSDSPDSLAFVVLSPISAGQVIRFTDCGWRTSGSFRTGEGGVAFTAATNLSPGTVISKDAPFSTGDWVVDSTGLGGSLALSTSGDQLIAFQGDAGAPDFVYAIHNDSSGWNDASSSNTTALPDGLVDGATAVFIGDPESDNGYYNGTTAGTPEDLRAAIGDSDNWETDNSLQSWPAWSFNVVIADVPIITGVSLSESIFEIDDAGVVTVQLDEAPAVGEPATISVSSGAFDISPVEVVIVSPDVSGTASVVMANEGSWTAQAEATTGCAGVATSDGFSVGTITPVAYAGADREIVLSGSSVTESMSGATADRPGGLAGVTYAWTPATGPGLVGWSNRTGAVGYAGAPSQAMVTMDQSGVYTFTLTVTDAELETDQDSVTITVSDEVVADDYDPPGGYYDPARSGGEWLTGAALKNALHGIIDGHTSRSYDAAKVALPLLNEDPNDTSRQILIYTGESVSKAWDSAQTWNREHMWPSSRNPGGAVYSDLFNLTPCATSVNGSRGNKPFGTGAGFWDPNQGAIHRGDTARIMFYDDTRYTELSLVDGNPDDSPGDYDMGDLASLIEWHYEDIVSVRERRHNHLVYDSGDNPQYYQGNRNPFVDYPELVWAIWGDHPNDAGLYVGGSPPADGMSSVTIDLGAVIVGGPVPSAQAVTIHKIGADPTTFGIIGGGDAVSAAIGPRQAFVGGTGSKVISAGLDCSTVVAGLKSGSLTADNTELTSSGNGRGSADGNDTINIELRVQDHSEASFDVLTNMDVLTIDFGYVPAGCGVASETLVVANVEVAAGFTAALDLDLISPAGDAGALYTDLEVFSGLAAGGSQGFAAYFDTSLGEGVYEATYTLGVSDENLPGAQSGASLVLTLRGTVAAYPFDDAADGVVDVADFQRFAACLAGPDGATLTDPCAACNNHDADGDGDVDIADFALFQRAFVGE